MEKLEYFVVQPSIKTFGGIKVDKNTRFDVYNDDKTVHQVFNKGFLTTHIKRELNYNEIKSTETSKMETQVPLGTILLWDEANGYIIPNYNMVKPEEARELLSKIVDITKPIEDGTKKAMEG